MSEAKASSKSNRFEWSDPFLLEAQLSEEENLIRESAHAFAQEKLLPQVSQAYLNETVNTAIFKDFGALGLLGITIPAEYGGGDGSYVSYGIVAREIERVDSGYRSMMSVQSSLVMYPIHAYGSEEQRRK